MKITNIVFGLLVLLAAIAVPPAMMGSVMAAAAGLFMVATAALPPTVTVAPAHMPATVALRAPAPLESVKVVEVGRGLVVFHQIDGKLVSQFIRTQS